MHLIHNIKNKSIHK